MSIVFRYKYALGLIPSADQLDAKWDKLIKMRDNLNRMESSNELRQYQDLKNLIDSKSFQQHKREVESLQYTGSKEESLILELKALAKSFPIRNYHKISMSPNLERLQNILAGSDLRKFLDLQKVVECNDFKIRKASQKRKLFITTPEYVQLNEYVQLRKSIDIRFWRKFSHSESYLSYLKTIGSKELKRFEELVRLTGDTDFKTRVDYLKDKKRYLKSEAYKNSVSFKELDKGKFMSDYRVLKKARQLDFFKKWENIFDEDFSSKELSAKHWQAENWLAFRIAGVSFSQMDEMQCFNGDKNIQLANNTISLLAKREKLIGKVWDSAIGLIPKEFDYSSAILNSADFFRFKEGVLEAKVRFKKDATITSAFSLTGEKPFPQIDFFRSTKNGVGLGILENQGKRSSKYLKIGGLNDEKFHIFTLELTKNELVWKINGSEVFRTTTSIREPLFFNLLTSLHGKVNEHKLPHRFEVEWIRCFSQKS